MNEYNIEYYTIYDRLLELNSLPQAYEEWAEYRAEVTLYILNHTGKDSSALIIGAGQCNDLDLKLLSEHFSSITLADIDVNAVQNGIKKQKINEEKMKNVKADIIGVDETSIRMLSYKMEGLASREKKDLTDDFLDSVRDLFSKRIPDPIYEDPRFDYVICIGVHSQLLSIYPRISRVFAREGLMQQEKVESFISHLNDSIMPEINQKILSIAKLGAIIGIEMERIGIPDAIEGAIQAVDDLRSRKEVQIEDEISLIWPFDTNESHAYRISLVSVRK